MLRVRTRHCRVPTINRGRETALPRPLYYSGATGIDINCVSASIFQSQLDRLTHNHSQRTDLTLQT